MPGLAAGFSFLQGYALAGHRGFNLRGVTVNSLAEEVARPHLHRQNLTLLRQEEAGFLLFALLKDLAVRGSLTYFSGLEATAGLGKALSAAIGEMKLAGLTPAGVAPESFLDPAKGEDMLLIWREYEKRLKEEGLLDRPALLSLAAKLGRPRGPLYIIPANISPARLEEELLQSLAGEQGAVPLVFPAPLGQEDARRQDPTRGQAPSPAPPGGESPFLWLYRVEDLPLHLAGKARASLFHAYGEVSEVREILRCIRERGLPLDRCALYCTATEPYTQHLYQASRLYRLPMTFGEGVSILNSGPGRFLASLLAWAGDGWRASRFHALLAGPDLEFPRQGAAFQASLARAFRSLNIGWGRERYLPCLDRQLARGEGPADLPRLRDFLVEVLDRLPAPDDRGRVEAETFFYGTRRLVDGYGSTRGPLDAGAKEKIAGLLEGLARTLKGPLPLPEVLLLAEQALAGSRVGRSTPRPGSLHVDSCPKGAYTPRPHTFIAGLDALRFPGTPLEDPVLLDVEREKLSPHLPLRRFRARENLYAMVQLLVLQEGEVTLSFSSHDTVEGRSLFPSPLLLQVHRLKEGDPRRDYSSLAGELSGPRGFAPRQGREALDEGEWWLSRFQEPAGLTACGDLLYHLYPGLREGMQAHSARLSGTFNAYGGKVESMAWENPPLSASQLEALSKCPFGYFLRYILGISPPVEPAYDPGAWLDPASRGTLLHAIFEAFYKEIQAKKEMPSFQKHRDLLLRIADGLMEREREACPPPHPVVFQQEKQEMLDSCLVFLKSEEALAGKSSPRFFEFSFGMAGRGRPGGGAVTIALPSGKHFRLRGIIDRVDMLDEARALILDYKTGSTYVFHPYKYYRGGRQLQHTLYAVALEEVFRAQDPGRPFRVAQAGYYFPTLKGEGQRILRDQKDRSDFYAVLELLHDMLTRGAFPPTDDGKDPENSGDCRYCDYPGVCRGRFYEEALARMLADSREEDLELLRRLRTYD